MKTINWLEAGKTRYSHRTYQKQLITEQENIELQEIIDHIQTGP